MATYPSAADIGGPVRIETTDFDNGERPLTDIDYYVVHDTEGHYEGDIAVLTHGSRNGSVHAIIGREVGQFCASVPITRSAFTAGNDQLGDRAIQVELSKATNEHGYTDWQYTALARFFQWCKREGVTVPFVYLGLHPADADNGPLPDERGIIGHAGVPNPNVPGAWGGVSGHTDPGPDFDWPRFIGLLGNAPTPAPPADPKVNGHVLAGGFRALWESNPDRMRAYGLPISEEYPALLGDLPVTAMDLERVQFVYDVSTPDPFRVRVPLRSEKVRKVR